VHFISQEKQCYERNGGVDSVTERRSEAVFDREWLKAALARWNLGDEFVRYLDAELLTPEHPLRQVMGQDFPKVMRELVRLRPDLV
jgi:hypothetical protein